MKKAVARTGCGLLVMLVMVMGISACAGIPEPEYADAMTENILQAMEAGDYDGYCKHFDEYMKREVTESAFKEINTLIETAIGSYESKEYWKTVDDGTYLFVYYRARFSQEPENVIVEVIFQEVTGEVYVAGVWFDSPKLRGAFETL